MQNRNYNAILYFIASVILITLAIQVYWNYKNYQAGKRQLINEVQISLDNAVDSYYTQLAQRNTVGLVMNAQENDTSSQKFTNLIKKLNLSKNGIKGLDSINPKGISNISIYRGLKADSLADAQVEKSKQVLRGSATIKKPNNLTAFTSKIVISITEDSIQPQRLDSLLQSELKRKNLAVDYGFRFTGKDAVVQEVNPVILKDRNLKTTANSSLLPKKGRLTLYFTNVTATILKRNLVGILLSALLIAAVIACLLFLLHIINRQKQLAELKNDLISNITHEFKTPIATIGVALEGIENFNAENDPPKTKNYVRTSSVQLQKLNLMVEKLLETATLDGNEMQLNKEEVELVALLQNLINNHRSLAPHKDFFFDSFRAMPARLDEPFGRAGRQKSATIQADPFYLENALNNILDNAVKYGGNQIKVTINAENRNILIKFEDNGNDLTLVQAKQIFEKFYRVPKGNTHDVRGFGIGLYYTKKIIEKHGGSVEVGINNDTTFTILLPHV